MSGELAPLSKCLAACGVDIDSPQSVDVLRLLRVVSAEVRTYTHRLYAVDDTVYEEVLDTWESDDLLLPAVPVTDLLSMSAVYWDGTEDPILTPEYVTGGYTTALAATAAAGATNLKVDSVAGVAVGDHVLLGSSEVVRVTAVGTAGSGGTGLTIEPALHAQRLEDMVVRNVSGSTYWRLVDEVRGKVERRGTSTRFVRAIWRASGGVPEDIENAVIEWVKSRWAQAERSAGQSSYSTGQDSESWDLSKAGHPPPDSMRIFMRYWRPSQVGATAGVI